jgi:hypothetical protein
MNRRQGHDELAELDARILSLHADAIQALTGQISIKDRLERVLCTLRDPPVPDDEPEGVPCRSKDEGDG